ncbi:MAG: RrF2 family transcriptional regulator [Alphaproteobacteria bacterium]
MQLKISKRMMFVIISVVDIAYTNSDKPVQTKDIANRHNIPVRYLEKALQGLVKNNILKGRRGPSGGYSLAKEKRKITLADIVKVVNEIEAKEQKSFVENDWVKKVLNPIWQDMNEMNTKHLESISLQDLFKIATDKNIGMDKPDDINNFMI